MSTQAKHTPGPWKEKRKLAIYSADDEPICAVFPAETDERSTADARLIAAAPDLLSALRNMLCEVRMSADTENRLARLTIEHAEKAIAKAEWRAGE